MSSMDIALMSVGSWTQDSEALMDTMAVNTLSEPLTMTAEDCKIYDAPAAQKHEKTSKTVHNAPTTIMLRSIENRTQMRNSTEIPKHMVNQKSEARSKFEPSGSLNG